MKTAILFLLILSFFSGCFDESPPSVCSSYATVKDLSGFDGCGFVFQLTDGSYLEPYRMLYCGTPPLPKEVTEDPLYNFEFVDGKRVRIGYSLPLEMAGFCMVGPIVKITCIEEIDSFPEE